MKKTIITIAAVLTLGAASLLSSCAGNTTTGGNGNADSSSQSATENMTEKVTEKSLIGDAENMIDDMFEDATHGTNDGTFGGHSTRGGNTTLFPQGK